MEIDKHKLWALVRLALDEGRGRLDSEDDEWWNEHIGWYARKFSDLVDFPLATLAHPADKYCMDLID